MSKKTQYPKELWLSKSGFDDFVLGQFTTKAEFVLDAKDDPETWVGEEIIVYVKKKVVRINAVTTTKVTFEEL